MIDPFANPLLKPWLARGLLILKGKPHYVEVDVPYLALDADEVTRALSGSFEYLKAPEFDRRTLVSGTNEDEFKRSWEARNREIAVAQSDLALAAAVLARRSCLLPLRVTRGCLHRYLQMWLLRGGRGIINPGPVEFLFLADGSTPTVYATDPIADVTRYSGRDVISVRITAEEMTSQVRTALRSAGDKIIDEGNA